MSKAILILDEMPKSCLYCDISKEAFDEDFAEILICGSELSEITYGKDRPSWCPLKPLPEKKEEVFPPINIEKDDGVKNFIKPVYLKDLFKYAVAKGYNKAIDEITGGEE